MPGVVPIRTPSLKKIFFSVSSTILRENRRPMVMAILFLSFSLYLLLLLFFFFFLLSLLLLLELLGKLSGLQHSSGWRSHLHLAEAPSRSLQGHHPTLRQPHRLFLTKMLVTNKNTSELR